MSESKQCVLISVDGMRPDGLRQAEAPNMDRLIAAGAHTFDASTVMPSVTLPCHMSMFHSVPPERHGVTTNTWTPQVRPVPGIFEAVHKAGQTTASFRNWDQLRDLGRPDSMNVSLFYDYRPDSPASDEKVAAAAIEWLGINHEGFAFVYLGNTDVVGHDHGWMSGPYIEAIGLADKCIGQVLAVLNDDVFLVVTADHGGHDRSHGTEGPEDMTIPMILGGPGAASGSSLPADTSILDVAPTIAAALGVTAPDEWEGKSLL